MSFHLKLGCSVILSYLPLVNFVVLDHVQGLVIEVIEEDQGHLVIVVVAQEDIRIGSNYRLFAEYTCNKAS